MSNTQLEYNPSDFLSRNYVYDLFGFLLNQGQAALNMIEDELQEEALIQDNDRIIYQELRYTIKKDDLQEIDLDIFYKYLMSKYPDNFLPKDLQFFLIQCKSKEISFSSNLQFAKDRAILINRSYSKYCLFQKVQELYKTLNDNKTDLTNNYIEVTSQLAADIKNITDLQQKTTTSNYISAVETTREILQQIKDDKNLYEMIPTGFSPLDEKLGGGLSKGTLNIIGARPSVGKTALASNILLGVINEEHKKEDPKPALFFTMEMTAVQIVSRMYASLCGVNPNQLFKKNDPNFCLGAIRTKSFFYALQSIFTDSQKRNYLDFYTKGSLNISTLKKCIEDQKNKYGGLSCIVLDYLQLMQFDPKQNRSSAIGEVSAYLKQVALDLNIPIIALAQLNREMEKGNRRKPRASDIKDSGSIEQDADLIMLIHKTSEEGTKRTIIIDKNRNGEPAELDCDFVGENCLFVPENSDNKILEFLIDNSQQYYNREHVYFNN